MQISEKEFMAMQPNKGHVADSDHYYLQLANDLCRLWDDALPMCMPHLPEPHRKAVVLAVMGYYQDVVTDAGIWRSFVTLHEHLYGTPLPFYGRRDDYVDYELNIDDLRFIIWYTLEGQQLGNYAFSPLDTGIELLATLLFRVLEAEYVEAPPVIEYNVALGVAPDDESDARAILQLSRWLFFDCYFMRPAAKQAIAGSLFEARKIIAESRESEVESRLSDLGDRTMLSNPTGPLSLTVGQWIKLIATGELPQLEQPEPAKPHPLYNRAVKAAGGSPIAFFATVAELAQFMMDTLHYPHASAIVRQLHGRTRFVTLALPDDGHLIVAPEVAQFVAHTANPCYDARQAAAQGHTLITEPRRCPHALVRYLFAHNLLPDAALPGDHTGLLHANWPFLLRLYHQPSPE